jgi:serine/threonine protein phosphatase PrpC
VGAKSKLGYRAAALTDVGVLREQNEDAVLLDRAAGAFAVVDGMGGHAGGQKAAELALEALKKGLKETRKDPERRVREAIAQANRAIHDGRKRYPEYHEMACVLTALVIDQGRVTAGHVGDTRLYKLQGDRLTQISIDHSPVGELVRAGRLTEEEAMRHPHRNLVLRDVGSTPRSPDEPGFIDIYKFDFEPDAALLLCSDGLCDQVPPADILALVKQNAPAVKKICEVLVERSNRAGGKDNVSVVIVLGPQFAAARGARSDDSTERLDDEEDETAGDEAGSPIAWLAGFLLLLALGTAGWYWWNRPAAKPEPSPDVAPRQIVVDAFGTEDATHTKTLQAALARALPGTVIEIRAAEYTGPFTLVNGVALRGERGATLRAPGSAAVLQAEGLSENVSLTGLHIAAEGALRGVAARASTVSLRDVKIAGAREAAVLAEKESTVDIAASELEIPAGASGVVATASAVTLKDNKIRCAVAATTRALEFRQAAGAYRVVEESNTFPGCDEKRILRDPPPPAPPKPPAKPVPGRKRV